MLPNSANSSASALASIFGPNVANQMVQSRGSGSRSSAPRRPRPVEVVPDDPNTGSNTRQRPDELDDATNSTTSAKRVLFPTGRADPAYQAAVSANEKSNTPADQICLRCKQGPDKCSGVAKCILPSNCFLATKCVA